MYSGLIIDELMAVVAEAEENADGKLAPADELYSLPLPQYGADVALAGVA